MAEDVKKWLKNYWLKKGTKVEMEHADTLRSLQWRGLHTDKEIAEMIAKDHLKESPYYYEYLEKMEKKLKKLKK